jgi:pilus assembly protein Flp/PilA
MEKIIRFFTDEDGVTALEYSLIAALIAVVIITAVTATGGAVSDTFDAVKDALNLALNPV